MPEDKKEGEGSKEESKKGIFKELKKGNKRSMLGIAVALAGIIVAWFLYQRSQAQQAQSAAGSTFMPYTPGATAGSGTPITDDIGNQLFQQQGQFQASMDLGFSGLSDSLAGLSTKFDDLNSSLSSHETPGGTVTPSPTPFKAKRYVLRKSGHPVSYAYLEGLGYLKGTPGHYLTTGKGPYPANHPVDYAYLSTGPNALLRRA